MERFERIFRGGTLVNHNGIGPGDVGVRAGRIAAIGDLGRAGADETVDCAGLHVLPGVIDSQVHFREPGMDHKEDLETGGLSAVAGGVTAVFEMPNTLPPTTTAEAINDKLARAKGRMHCDHAFFAGGAATNVAELAQLERLPGVCGIKVFIGASTGTLLVPDDATIEAILRSGTRRVAFHCEDEFRMNERRNLRVTGDPSSHPVWRDVESARRATERVLRLARRTGRRVHILHITTAEEPPMLAAHKDVATMEVLPQHLTFAAPEAYERLGTRVQMNPPIREHRHREALWAAVNQGIVDVIGSDHAPHTLEEKSRDYPATPSGMTGVQTLVPVMLTHVNEGRLSLERFVDLTSTSQQRVFGIAGKGRMAVGYDADLTIVDMKAERVIEDSWIRSRVGWTPYHGMTAKGWPVMTVVRGRIVMREDEIAGPAAGAPVRFIETLRGEAA